MQEKSSGCRALTAFSETPSLELREGKWQGKEQGGEGGEENEWMGWKGKEERGDGG